MGKVGVDNVCYYSKYVFSSIFLISLFIESTQVVLSLIVPNICRFFEINDLILNSTGGILGWKLYNNLSKKITHSIIRYISILL